MSQLPAREATGNCASLSPTCCGQEGLEYAVASLWDASLGLGGCHPRLRVRVGEHPQQRLDAQPRPSLGLQVCSPDT